MFKLFFWITLLSGVLIWFCHEYHNDKFMQIVNQIPYSALIASRIHSYFGCSSFHRNSEVHPAKVFTPDELQQFNGERGSKGTYLAILGEVFDVAKGQRHYGPGGPYHIFAGRDASRSFVTGDFNSMNPVDHTLDLSLNELLSLRDWLKFYKKEYEYKGKLIGRYYNADGTKTDYWEQLQQKFNEAEKSKKAEKDDELLFPPCNVEWNAETGTKVWCSNKSGGIERSWIGVPRKLYMVGSESYRCACIDMNEIQKTDSPQYARRKLLQIYENCDPSHNACFIRE